MAQKLHIVSFDIPFPANYGGVIDVFFKIRALSNLGVKIHLHCFEYHRAPNKELEKYCEKVSYYPRKISSRLLFHKLPYIVISRQSEELVNQIQRTNAPVLMEGLHCTWLLNDRYWNNRNMIVRTHNIEHEYYKQLARIEKNLFKKYYFLNESTKLATYETILTHSSGICTITDKEKEYFNKYHHNVATVSGFHGHNTVLSNPGRGNYVLYHGNLSVGENHKAAMTLIENLGGNKVNLVVAGNNPRKELKDKCKEYKNIKLEVNPDDQKLRDLIREAQINLLITFQPTGLKLKLLNALFEGRHCIVNQEMVIGTGLEDTCTVLDSTEPEPMIEAIDKYYKEEFTIDQIKERDILLRPYIDTKNAEALMKMLFQPQQ